MIKEKIAKEIVKEGIKLLGKEDVIKAFKRGNQRIAEIGKQFSQNSNVYRNEVAKLMKGAMKKYIGISASGNVKFNIPQIIHAFESGELDESEFNEILQSASGLIYKDGELIERGKGISTISDIKERAYDYDSETEDWRETANEQAEIEQNFQTEYEDYKRNYKTLKSRKRKFPKLYEKGYKRSYEDLEDLTEQLRTMNANFKKRGKARKDANNKLKQ